MPRSCEEILYSILILYSVFKMNKILNARIEFTLLYTLYILLLIFRYLTGYIHQVEFGESWLIWVGKTLPWVLDHLYSNADMKIQILKLHLAYVLR